MIATIQCTDQVGLVAAISGVMAAHRVNIIAMREHVDTQDHLFFARLELEQGAEAATLHTQLQQVLPAGAAIRIIADTRKKIALLVTKEYHCLGDILLRHHFATLGASVECVIGNHALLDDICRRFDVPFHLVPHNEKDQTAFENHLLQVLQQYTFDYLVLAKFMRILSPGFLAHYPLQLVNIHHSFLPAFAGASPYRQAYERGVKLIGATAHFVTSDLDEGPIITQQIIPVNHSYTVKDMMHAGREIETAVLAKALQLVLNDRVFVFNNKTVVFE